MDVAVTGTANARVMLRFFLDDGSIFDVVYSGSPSELDAVHFDLSRYAARTLAGDVYIELTSSDGNPVSIDITQIAFVAPVPLSPVVPLSGWTMVSQYTNAPYVLNSTASSLSLELGASSLSSRVMVRILSCPKLSLSDYGFVDVAVTGSANARVMLRFFLDDGSIFDVVYSGSPSELDAVHFDLSRYAARTLAGDVYIELTSSDGNPVSIDITQIAFVAPVPLSPVVPLSGWTMVSQYTNAPYVLNSTASSLSLELGASSLSSRVMVRILSCPKLSLSDYGFVDVAVTGSANARVMLRFFLDDGSIFDVVYSGSPSELDAVHFDLSRYAARTLAGDVYIELTEFRWESGKH